MEQGGRRTRLSIPATRACFFFLLETKPGAAHATHYPRGMRRLLHVARSTLAAGRGGGLLAGGGAPRGTAPTSTLAAASTVPPTSTGTPAPPFPAGLFGGNGGGSDRDGGSPGDASSSAPRTASPTEPAPPADPPPPGTKAAETDEYVREALALLDYPARLVRLLMTPQREVHSELVLTRDNGVREKGRGRV